MITVKATWKNGQIVPDDAVPWREGCRLVIREAQLDDVEFMTEAQQRDDPEAVQAWIDEMHAIPPLPMTFDQEADLTAWRQKVKAFNLEAVRRQMEEGIQ